MKKVSVVGILFAVLICFLVLPDFCRAADKPVISDPSVIKKEFGWDITFRYEGAIPPQRSVMKTVTDTIYGPKYRTKEVNVTNFKDGKVNFFFPQIDSHWVGKIEVNMSIFDAEGHGSNTLKLILE
jgi:hypothetical protein